ncbi:hypothetical protein [Marixanthomonas spongiae]|uniref:6-bladed beta-propeller n=1 Tax=Marixanthomonas spongiae TaxID=2174845 RepID=A0A2U0I7R5_9FLAO|nr:hypothetical protein [Marixanthomonas spongiae]PVW17141.1 hypothetical protein DDV96_01070 [Marixanthomonas spongiae]
MKVVHLIFLLLSPVLLAQPVIPISKTPLKADGFIGVDAFTNMYYTANMELHKTGVDGDFVFSDLQLGPITSVDILNPLNVVIFYENTNTVVLVDNKLNEIERINFNTLPGFLNISTATNAGNNRLWVFNVDTQQLELFNYRTLTNTAVSQPFSGTLLSQTSNFNYCYVLTENKVRAFNVYGSLLSEIKVDGFINVLQQDERVLGVKENSLYYLAQISEGTTKKYPEAIKIPLPQITIKDLSLTQEFLYIYDGKNIHTLKLTHPKK